MHQVSHSKSPEDAENAMLMLQHEACNEAFVQYIRSLYDNQKVGKLSYGQKLFEVDS